MSERELTQSPWVHNTGGVGTVSNGGGGGEARGGGLGGRQMEGPGLCHILVKSIHGWSNLSQG